MQILMVLAFPSIWERTTACNSNMKSVMRDYTVIHSFAWFAPKVQEKVYTHSNHSKTHVNRHQLMMYKVVIKITIIWTSQKHSPSCHFPFRLLQPLKLTLHTLLSWSSFRLLDSSVVIHFALFTTSGWKRSLWGEKNIEDMQRRHVQAKMRWWIGKSLLFLKSIY